MSVSTKRFKGKKGNSNANAISDRSGFRHPMHEMIVEPGTGYLIHRSESDGRWNFVDHPQAHINEYAHFGDPFPVADARPDIIWSATSSTVMGEPGGTILGLGYLTFSLINTSLIDDYSPWPYTNR